MHIVGILAWWYTGGLRLALSRVAGRVASVFDYFSIDILLKTLFSPFRQISAGRVNGPIGVQLRAFVDQLVSRVIGAVVRSIVMIIGLLVLTVSIVLGLVFLALWLIAPGLPILGFSLMAIGWIPWHL